ncbi:HepT-like ribonuclease domain-containing protein [Deinococcus sp. UYEF24]
MPRNDRERLEDALEAANNAINFGANLSLEALRADLRTLAAIKYELVVLGEAVAGISQTLTDLAPDLPWKQMRGLRNVITHEYFRVDVSVIHQLVAVDLPALTPRFALLL